MLSQSDWLRFDSKFIPTTPEACWRWGGSVSSDGYGSFKACGKTWRAPRLAVARFGLAALDSLKGLLVCHRCDNPICVNPGHLFVGSASDNAVDAMAKGRVKGTFKIGDLHRRSVLPNKEREALRRLWRDFGEFELFNRHDKSRDKLTFKHLADLCGISDATVRSIVYRRR